jgi:hypothetical protein
MKKCRIVKRTGPTGHVQYVIQQKHFLFRWMWVDAWMNTGTYDRDSFFTMEEAIEHLPYYDGTPTKEEVVK